VRSTGELVRVRAAPLVDDTAIQSSSANERVLYSNELVYSAADRDAESL